jgi:hypothetical protein
MSCPYNSEELDDWGSVNNPMGLPCYSCGEWECEHNFNADKYYSHKDFVEEE